MLWGSQVCYANEEKARLGVDASLFSQVGAVSSECALAMADEGLKRLQCDAFTGNYLSALSITGIAGPGGATARKAVGLFYVGLALWDARSGKKTLISQQFNGSASYDRARMKLYMAKAALEFLRVNFLSLLTAPESKI